LDVTLLLKINTTVATYKVGMIAEQLIYIYIG
jgi:hypothetical protein